MKVWMCTRNGVYSGGLAVVAANTKEEAFTTFFSDSHYDWMVEKFDLENGKWFNSPIEWQSNYYPLQKWFECKVLTTNVDKPCVIMEDGYTE